MQTPSVAVARASQISQHGNARRADGDVGLTQPPGSAKRVADDDADAFAGAPAERRRELSRGAVRSFGQDRDEIGLADVGLIHACIGAHKSVPGFRYEDSGATADDTARLLQNSF